MYPRQTFIVRYRRPFFLFFLLLFLSAVANAQNATTAITQASNLIGSYFDVAVTLLYMIGAIVGLIGAVKVFNAWNSGDPNTNKMAAAWFGSCIFLLVVATALKGFFGVN